MPELEQALDVLYGADLDEFISTRTRLTKELKKDGASEAAAEVASARKPVVSAWAVNQLARRHRRDVDLLLDAGHRLREAQSSLFGGSGQQEFAAARRAQQTALARLVKAARALVEERGGASQSTVEQIGETLRAAAVSEEGRERLALGRFERPLSFEGFDVLAGLAPPETQARPKTRKSTRRDRTRDVRVREDEERVREQDKRIREREARLAARAAVREAKAAVREAETAQREREREAEKAEREAERLRAATEDAEKRARAARAAADEAALVAKTADAALRAVEERAAT